MKPSRIFISHSSKDKQFANLVVAKLKIPDMAPWIDSEQIVTGDDILDQLGHGLRSMDVLLFLISQAALESDWVALEVKYAIKREITEKRILVLPFIIDDSPLDSLPWFLSHRNATRVDANADGAAMIVTAVRQSIERRSALVTRSLIESAPSPVDRRIVELMSSVKLADFDASSNAAFKILESTDGFGNNELFEKLLDYLYWIEDDNLRWGAIETIENLVGLAPWLVDRPLLTRFAKSTVFEVRILAANICMDLAQYAPDRVPLDLLFNLARYDEDWYVMAPATAALKAMVRPMPSVLQFFYRRMRDEDPNTREHAIHALNEIAETEPEIMDAEQLNRELAYLRRVGHKETAQSLDQIISKVKKVKHINGYKYTI